MNVRIVAFLAVLLIAELPAPVFADSPCPGIHVKILNIRNSTGTVACALFESAEGYPNRYMRFATNIMIIKIRKSEASCDFDDIPAGSYAMAVIHDENMNGELDTQWAGIPTEGYGFSNNPKALLGAPSFSAASFIYDGRALEMKMGLTY